MSIVGDGRVPCIDDFDVGQELGKGGFAVVYRARVRVSGLEVALKVVDKRRASEIATQGIGGDGGGELHKRGSDGMGLACARVANEVRLHWGLKHPTVVELLDFFEDERFVYMVLELCGGGDLYRRLRTGGPLSETEAAAYMGQLLAGLAYLHGRRIIHRDLKLSNLLLSQDRRRLRIADFGLAVALRDADHETHTICGTPNYMAPEVQDSGYGLAADLWSAGCLFYAMVTGGAPFQGGRVGETLANARAGRYLEPDGLSGVARDFMARMLELDPRRRLSVKEAASHPFLRLDAGSPGAISTRVSVASPSTAAAASSRHRVKADRGRGSGKMHQASGTPPPAPLPILKGRPGDVPPLIPSKVSGGAKRRTVRSPSAADYPGVIDSSANESVAGGGAGNSTLTASTAMLGLDRSSVSSGAVEEASVTTLRAEAVPTPATIGASAAAAAARARRAAANAPCHGSFVGASGAKVSGGGKIVASSEQVVAARAQSHTQAYHYEVVRKGTRKGESVKLGQKLVPMGDAVSVLRDKSENLGDVVPVREEAHRLGSRPTDGHRRHGLDSDGPARGFHGSDFSSAPRKSAGISLRVAGQTQILAGKSISDKEGVRDGVNAGSLMVHEKRLEPSVFRDEIKVHRDRSGSVPLENGRTMGNSGGLDSRVPTDVDAGPGAPREGLGAGNGVRRRGTRVSTASDDSVFRESDASTRSRVVGKVSEDRIGCKSGSSGLHSPASFVGVGEKQNEHRQRDRRELGDPPSPVRDGTNRRRTRHSDTGGGSDIDVQKSFGPDSPTSRGGVADDGRSTGGRRRPRPVGSGDGDTDRQAPRPPLPPQPPPPQGEAGSSLRRHTDLRELHESQATADSERRLHELSGIVEKTPNAEGRPRVLTPLSTARLRPVSHCSEEKAASAEILCDGRAGICVGRRWLISSANGERVWWGIGNSSYADESRHGGRQDTGQSLQSLPEVLHPLYRSLAGIVGALRSKTPKVVIRREQVGSRRVDTGERRVMSCALMENLPDPDFVAAFEDGSSLAFCTKKQELRLEVPSRQARRFHVASAVDWSNLAGSGPSDPDGHGRAGDARDYVIYLRNGLRAYCVCLKEEAAAYRRGASFPVEAIAEDAGPEKVAARSGGKPQRGVSTPSSAAAGNASGDPASVRRLRVTALSNATALRPGLHGRAEDARSIPPTKSSRPPNDRRSRRHEAHEKSRRRSPSSDVPVRADSRDRAGAHAPERAHGEEDSRAYVRSDFHEPYRSRRGRGEGTPAGRVTGYGSADRDPNTGFRAHDSTAESDTTRFESESRPRMGNVARHVRSSSTEPSRANVAESVSLAADGSRERGSTSPAIPRPRRSQVREQTRMARTRDENTYIGGPRDSYGIPSASESCSTDQVGSRLRVGLGRGEVARRGGGDRSGQADDIAVIPGLGRAFRDRRGDLEVRFDDGVVVVVDAEARWMRVKQTVSDPSSPLDSEGAGYVGREESVTYDIGRDKADAGRRRMPKDVKRRMKVLPQFITLLRSSSAQKSRRYYDSDR